MKKRKIPLEVEKKFNEERWSEVLKELEQGKIDKVKIVSIMDRINIFDLIAIRSGRRDLLG